MNWWVITDTHFNHESIMIPYCRRPDNYGELLRRGLQQIPENDILIHLGDITIGEDLAVHADIIDPLKYRKILVRGNHDNKSVTWYLTHGWDFVVDRFSLRLFGKDILFMHKPDITLPLTWNGIPHLNIHGHFHNTNHRILDPEFRGIELTDRHLLLAVEETRYQPVTIKKFLQHKRVI